MEPVKVLEQYLFTFDLPDDNKHSRHSEASKALKAKGCTVFREQSHYDITSDGLKKTITGYVV